MGEYVVWATVFAVGLILGFFYFPLLWLTIKRLADSERPVRLMTISFVARFAVVITIFYFVMGDHAERLLFALAGFVLAREICKRFWGRELRGKRLTVVDRVH